MTNGHVESGQVEKMGICQQPLQLIAQPLDDHGKPWGCGGCFLALPSYGMAQNAILVYVVKLFKAHFYDKIRI
jgi:hypothetical protein